MNSCQLRSAECVFDFTYEIDIAARSVQGTPSPGKLQEIHRDPMHRSSTIHQHGNPSIKVWTDLVLSKVGYSQASVSIDPFNQALSHKRGKQMIRPYFPAVGCSSPMSIFRSVLLPAPLGPVQRQFVTHHQTRNETEPMSPNLESNPMSILTPERICRSVPGYVKEASSSCKRGGEILSVSLNVNVCTFSSSGGSKTGSFSRILILLCAWLARAAEARHL